MKYPDSIKSGTGKIIVWIQCKTGEYLDPKKISSISVLSCYGGTDEVEIFAEYGGHTFLLYRMPRSSLQKMGVRNNQEKFQAIITEMEKKHEQSNTLTFEDIFTLILTDDHEPGMDRDGPSLSAVPGNPAPDHPFLR